jgi:hypothetical protein
MWIRTPESIENPIWEFEMEPVSNDAVERLVRENNKRGLILKSDDLRKGLPILSIGLPEIWDISALYPPDKLPQWLEVKLDESDFYLVRFSCSFRPLINEKKIEWARFIVQLYHGEQGQPIAFDLHPMMVAQEAKHNVKVTLSPTIKFQELGLGASLGGVDFGLEYIELLPIISATGIGEGQASWDYEEARGSKIQGVRNMHMILKVPKGMKPVVAFLDLIADVRIRDQILRLNVGRKEMAAKSLRVNLIE